MHVVGFFFRLLVGAYRIFNPDKTFHKPFKNTSNTIYCSLWCALKLYIKNCKIQARSHALSLMLIRSTAILLLRSILTATTRMSHVRLLMTSTNEIATQPWYKDGLSFKCSMCGNCCSGSSGSVRFSAEEAITMSDKLAIDIDDFYDTFTRKVGKGKTSFIELKEKRYSDGTYDCIFLDRKTIPGKKICSLYDARFLFPFHIIRQSHLNLTTFNPNQTNAMQNLAFLAIIACK